MTLKYLLLIFFIGLTFGLSSQEDNLHRRSSEYEAPTDPQVQQKLEEWKDLKFGMIIHWGLYAVPGIVESWQLCSEDWINRPEGMSYMDFKIWYWNLNKIFNPVNFDPESWADAADNAGMKYVVFTTKHHDGFSMFDTKYSDYKISAGPFRNHPKSNVAKHIFSAFRDKDFMVGAYFSKPDWHSPDFWWDKYATPDRNPNYNIIKYPERWKRYQDFTYNQISELMNDYGDMDILWLDGGWIRPKETVNDEVRAWGAPIPDWSQEVNMPKIATMARKAQPGLIIADRTVHGPYENYQTPERSIPEYQLENPWESCITLGNAWGYVPNDNFKSASKVIHMLVEIVAKGGSLLLGVGPQSDGLLPLEAVQRLEEIGTWMEKNGEAIYGTRSTKKYNDGNVFFTEKEDHIYAIALIEEGKTVPSKISWSGNPPKKGIELILLSSGESLTWKTEGEKVIVELPADAKENSEYAISIRYDRES